MEKYNLISLRKKPLPGERQGASGASAGRDNMRNIGGWLLNRRAPVKASADMHETATAENREVDNNQEIQVSLLKVLLKMILGPPKQESQDNVENGQTK
jgi:hypothetical protein